jgi:hypothetical protein
MLEMRLYYVLSSLSKRKEGEEKEGPRDATDKTAAQVFTSRPAGFQSLSCGRGEIGIISASREIRGGSANPIPYQTAYRRGNAICSMAVRKF